MCVNNLPRVALDSGEAGIRTRDLLIVERPNHSANEPHYVGRRLLVTSVRRLWDVGGRRLIITSLRRLYDVRRPRLLVTPVRRL